MTEIPPFRPVGIIRSPFTDTKGMPVQPPGARSVRGTVEVFPEYAEGLRDLEQFSRIILLYHLHACRRCELTVTPFLDSVPRGIFSTRAPPRPNPIGLSIVRLCGLRGTTLEIEDVDILDGTPLLDIKPYIPSFDAYPEESHGWLTLDTTGIAKVRSDRRFS